MRLRLAAGLTLALASATARAAPPEPATNEPELGFIVPLRWENDATSSGFFTYSDSDRYYTAGQRLGRFMTALRSVDGAGALGELGRLFGASRIGWGATPIALDLYTPGDITRSDAIPEDRPYAGWLRALAEVRLAWDRSHPLRGRLALSMGVVGPASFGEQAQRVTHELISAPDPRGWSHQVGRGGNLVVPQFTAGLEQRIVELRRSRLALSLWWHAALELGRAEGSTGLGATLRAGLMGARFGDSREGVEVVVFARLQGRAVAWNLFLAGGGGSHGVAGVPFVLETEWGLSLRFGRLFLHFAALSWSREQAAPPPPTGPWRHLADRSPWFEHQFGRLEIGWVL